MSFRIVDSETGKVLFETDNIVVLMDQLDTYEYEDGRPVKEIVPRISELGEELKITGRR